MLRNNIYIFSTGVSLHWDLGLLSDLGNPNFNSMNSFGRYVLLILTYGNPEVIEKYNVSHLFSKTIRLDIFFVHNHYFSDLHMRGCFLCFGIWQPWYCNLITDSSIVKLDIFELICTQNVFKYECCLCGLQQFDTKINWVVR